MIATVTNGLYVFIANRNPIGRILQYMRYHRNLLRTQFYASSEVF